MDSNMELLKNFLQSITLFELIAITVAPLIISLPHRNVRLVAVCYMKFFIISIIIAAFLHQADSLIQREYISCYNRAGYFICEKFKTSLMQFFNNYSRPFIYLIFITIGLLITTKRKTN